MTYNVLPKEEKTVVCQLCGQEVNSKTIKGLPVADDHHLSSGKYCEGSRVFGRPVDREIDIESLLPNVQKVIGPIEAQVPIINIQGTFSKFFSSLALLLR